MKATLRKGETPPGWSKPRRRQIDRDGRWTLKRGRKQAPPEGAQRQDAEIAVPVFGYKAYGVTPFVHELRERSVTPHIAIDGHLSTTGKRRKTAVDGRTTRHAGYDISQRCRKRIEEVFGWIKSSAGLAKVKLRGRARVDAAFTLALAAYNLIRLPKLLGAAP